MSFGSYDGINLYGSSASSNSRGSRSWVRGNTVTNHQFLVSDGIGPYFSSPSDISPAQQWTPPAIQEINDDDIGSSRRDVLRPLSFSPTMEGTSAARDSEESTSSRSDSSCEYESMIKPQSSHRNFGSRRCFMSKAIHPLSFPSETPARESTSTALTGMPELDSITPQKDRCRLMSASVDLTEISEPFEYDLYSRSCGSSDLFRCGLCERFLSQRSPWSSRRIVKSGDMPVAGVLSCRHVFHAECLDQTTPKAHKNDPSCPICSKVEENSPDPRVFSKLKSSFPRLKPFREDGGPSRPWGCAQAGDCVEGALHTPPRNTLLSLNRSRFRKTLSLKGNAGREYPGKLRKSGTFSSQLLIGAVEHGAAAGASGLE